MCPEAKDYFTKKTIKNIKHCNLMQIAHNNARKDEEKILESMWHEQMLNNVRNIFIFLYFPREVNTKDIFSFLLFSTLKKSFSNLFFIFFLYYFITFLNY